MPATVTASRVPTSGIHLRAGLMYSITDFDVALCNPNFRDIIGEITVVKTTVSDPQEAKKHLMATIKVDNDVSVTLSLFDSPQAVSLHSRLEAMRVDPRVIATSLNPKMVGGRLLVPTNTGLPSAASLLRGRAKVEYMTISELKEFVITAPSLDIDFLWKNGGVMLFALSAPKSFNAPSPHCENTHAVGALHQAAPDVGAAPDGDESKMASAEASIQGGQE
ncbi:Uncharacterized protein Rs2_17280 [Raphanus sativus]|nr:Uncharacterized protein Rs2_17280 [Raphanus sativus]